MGWDGEGRHGVLPKMGSTMGWCCEGGDQATRIALWGNGELGFYVFSLIRTGLLFMACPNHGLGPQTTINLVHNDSVAIQATLGQELN